MNEIVAQKIESLEKQISDLEDELKQLRKDAPAEPVKDYALKDSDGKAVTLSSLFGDKDNLVLIHNMGKSCAYCTIWADGFNGVYPYVENRAAFVLVNNDTPAEQKQFAAGRGWRFRPASAKDTPMFEDLDFKGGEMGWMPGMSVFRKGTDGSIARVAKSYFGPGDKFCSVPHIWEMLPA